MSAATQVRPHAGGPRGDAAAKRPRLPVLFAGAVLLWCAGWYCHGGDTALFWTTLVVAVLALVPSRPLAPTARAVIWSGVSAVFVCLAANVVRVTPPQGGELDFFLYDRVVTIGFAFGLAALFFRPSPLSVTVAAVAGMPMVMLTLVRARTAGIAVPDAWVVWGFLAWVVLLEHVQRLTRPRPAHSAPLSWRETAARLAIVALALLLAVGARRPITRGTLVVRQRLLGMLNVTHSFGSERKQAGNLSMLSMSAPGIGLRLRPLMAIESPTLPGYLRETVYMDYARGAWHITPGGAAPGAASLPALDSWSGRSGVYAVGPRTTNSVEWTCAVLHAGGLAGFCLPGGAWLLAVDGASPRMGTNGTLTATERLPERFQVRVRRGVYTAYPGPGAPLEAAYLRLPEPLVPDITNWVAAVAQLAGAGSARDAADAIVGHFRQHFTYSLGFRPQSGVEPLADFMSRREGHCTLYASVCALMLRAEGIPSRVVAGFLCTDRNPLAREWTVRERDAHAWVEAWDAGSGQWFHVEPTPPSGLPSAFPPPGKGRLLVEMVSAYWRRFVALIGQANIIGALASAGVAVFLFARQWLWNSFGLALAIVGAALLIWQWQHRRRPAGDPRNRLRLELERAMARFARRSVAAEMQRRPHESWADWLRRVQPVLPPSEARRLAELAEQYQSLRYRVTLDEPGARGWLQRIRGRNGEREPMILPAGLRAPPREFTLMPFWFWNDALCESELVRQLDDFERHGVYGFVIHPRVGLPRDLGWMSDRLLDFYELALREARRRGMQVILYDEGMYPSGSSCGQVVAANPAFACRCLARIDLPAGGTPELGPDEQLVAVVRRQGGSTLAVVDRRCDSYIRGLHFRGEGPAEDEPPAGDLLNPDAMATFVRLVYSKFAARFSGFFGNTVVAMFTDEPGLLGKSRERDVMPGTTGILAHVNRILGYDFTPHLPALWHDDEPDATRYRADYVRAVNLRLEETYYRQLSGWCQDHGVALAGHPHKGDDLGVLRHFQIPGQDTVWRWVLPDQPSALEGCESTQAKCSAAAMLHGGRRRNGNECCGAYGHELTWDEMCWLALWCFVRGVNMLFPHAFYYSVRGVRWDERPPDVGPHSAWWGRYGEHAIACQRLSWLNTDSTHVCAVAILGRSDWLPWRAAKACFEHQRDFNYLEERDILDRATVDAAGVHIAGMTYRVLVVEHAPELATDSALAPLAAAGRVIRFGEGASDEALLEQLDARLAPDVGATPPVAGLRVRHVVKTGTHYYLMFNETRDPLATHLRFASAAPRTRFDPFTGQARPWSPDAPLELAGHAACVLMA